MNGLSSSDRELLDRAAAAPMLDQVQKWAAINSGSRNLAGLAITASMLADAFSTLPGDIRLVEGAKVDAVDSRGRTQLVQHGQHLLLSVRPDAAIRLLLTGHMDTVFPADHGFQSLRWIDQHVRGRGFRRGRGFQRQHFRDWNLEWNFGSGLRHRCLFGRGSPVMD